MQQMAWLFTKNQQSVRIEVRSSPAGVQLLIEGPGAATSVHDFPPGTSVERFREDYERKLLTDGYRLQVVAERRGGDEGAPPDNVERRRRS